MLSYKTENNSLYISEKTIIFDFHIEKTLEIDMFIIVFLHNPLSGRTRDQPKNNIYAINFNGDIIWNIKEIVHEDNLYTGIRKEDDILVVINFNGLNYFIDVKTRSVLYTVGIK